MLFRVPTEEGETLNETLWAEPLGDDRYRLESPPFYAYGVARGDVVRAPVDAFVGMAAFEEVVAGCADPSRDGRWITPAVATAYTRLHELGWAHSVEVWRDQELVGGLYGLAVGRLFAAESKFRRVTDASKAAVVGLVQVLSEDGMPWVLDVQWSTPHLASLGVREVPRTAYLRMVAAAVAQEPPDRWRGVHDNTSHVVRESPGAPR